MNNITLIGRITKDMTIKKSKGGNDFVNFTIAVKRKRTDETDFFNCVAFGKLAGTITTYCKKGSMIGLQGRVEITNKKDGDKWNTFIDVIVEDITFTDKKEADSTQKKEVYDPFANFDRTPAKEEAPQTEETEEKKTSFGDFGDLFDGLPMMND